MSKTDILKSALEVFSPCTNHGPEMHQRSEVLHEDHFSDDEISALKAAGFAAIVNNGYNAYWVALTEAGRLATGLQFGWFYTGKLKEEMDR